MKTINYPNVFRKYFALLVCFIGVQFINVNSLKAQEEPCDCKKYQEKGHAAPTNCKDYCALIDSFSRIMPASIATTSSISLNSLKSYYLQFIDSIDRKDGGIRIYYGFYSGSIVQIICVSNKEDDPAYELGYYVLTNNNNNSGYNINPKNTITKDSTIKLIKKYFYNISISNRRLSEIIPNDTIRFARFYPYSEIKQLIKDIPSARGKAAFITLEQCYVPLSISKKYKDYSDMNVLNMADSFYVGHSTVMYLQAEVSPGVPGKKLTSATEPSNREIPTNYKSGFLEIGKPCPPRCGEITWKDIKDNH
jgi:hypothetical protein